MTAAIEESDREPAFGWQCMEDGLNAVYNFATSYNLAGAAEAIQAIGECR